jgi:hypothetical protein
MSSFSIPLQPSASHVRRDFSRNFLTSKSAFIQTKSAGKCLNELAVRRSKSGVLPGDLLPAATTKLAADFSTSTERCRCPFRNFFNHGHWF